MKRMAGGAGRPFVSCLGLVGLANSAAASGVQSHLHSSWTVLKTWQVGADQLVGGSDAVLVIDDTAVPKKGKPAWAALWLLAAVAIS
jgi:hypothetical protein